MKGLLISALAAALLLCRVDLAEGQERRWIRISVDDGVTVSVDALSVHPGPNSTREVWFKLEHSTVRQDTTAEGKSYTFVWELWFYRFDCAARTYAHLRRIQYSRDDRVVHDVDFTTPLGVSAGFTRQTAVVPQTNLERMFESGCSLPVRR